MSEKVLIIEDSPEQAAAMADAVIYAGYEAVIMDDLKDDVVELLGEIEPKLVLLDLELLGDMGKVVADGFSICHRIKNSGFSIPVAVISGRADDEARDWAMSQGADLYLEKPFVLKTLAETIRKLIGKTGGE